MFRTHWEYSKRHEYTTSCICIGIGNLVRSPASTAIIRPFSFSSLRSQAKPNLTIPFQTSRLNPITSFTSTRRRRHLPILNQSSLVWLAGPSLLN
jgi:hypothetical protein